MNLALLDELLQAHSTPGDEAQVATILEREWRAAGLVVVRHGHYAISARPATARPGAPTLLICAHMDSPGFIVERRHDDGWGLVTLGGAHFDGDRTPGRLKTRQGILPVDILKLAGQDEDGQPGYRLAGEPPGLCRGDRVCFAASLEQTPDGLLAAPFLDNRLGCWALVELARRAEQLGELNWVLGATACEEMGGFGAPVLARAVAPDAVVCLDATYEDVGQEVRLGGGPVLTLSDASVILAPATRDRLLATFAAAGLPLQTEVYNYSGTDSRAFPLAGLPAPVYALLLPTRGNHSPHEAADLADLEPWLAGICLIARQQAAAGRG